MTDRGRPVATTLLLNQKVHGKGSKEKQYFSFSLRVNKVPIIHLYDQVYSSTREKTTIGRDLHISIFWLKHMFVKT